MRRTRISEALLRELRRWTRPERPAGRHRWSAWARSLIERHRRAAFRYSMMDFVLVHRLPFVHLLRERWLVGVHSIHPRVHLAIQPVLRQTVWRERLLPGRQQSGSLLEREIIWRQHARLPAAHMPSRDSRLIIEKGSIVQAEGERNFFANGISAPAGEMVAAGIVSRSPLQLVFQRLRRVDEITRTHERHNTTQESIRTLVREVARRSQRLEQRITETVTLTLRKALPLGAQEAVTVAASAASQAAGNSAVISGVPVGPWAPSQAPTVNIEQLADQVVRQIDRRIIAARERMGRI